jgi:hypothetical protein
MEIRYRESAESGASSNSSGESEARLLVETEQKAETIVQELTRLMRNENGEWKMES